MPDLLFADRVRTDSSPSSGFESMFAFLDRVESAYFAQVRVELNRWFARYPTQHRPELRARLEDDENEFAAFWELLLHEVYVAAGYSVEIHPELPGTDKRP